jgi:hypothetical protein
MEALMPKEAHDVEMLNIVAKSSKQAAFKSEWVDAMLRRKYSERRTINHLFITIDPSATKNRNLYVLTSGFFVDGQFVVCFHSSLHKHGNGARPHQSGGTCSPPSTSPHKCHS